MGFRSNYIKIRDKLHCAGTGVSPVQEKRHRSCNNHNNGGDATATTTNANDTQKSTATSKHDKTNNNKKPTTTTTNNNNNNNNVHNGGSSSKPYDNCRPPVILMPGLASTRLVSWKFLACGHPLLSDIKVQDYVWLNINQLVNTNGDN